MQTIKLAHLKVLPKHRLLDLGCGQGRHCHAAYYETACHVIGLDLGYDDICKTRNGFEALPVIAPKPTQHFNLMVANALTLPFADNSMNRLICSEVLEHIPDYMRVIDEIERVTTHAALIGISVPRAWTEKICWWLSQDYHSELGGHIRIFKEQDLIDDFEARGFKLYKKHYAHALHTPYWWLRCVFGIKKELNFITRAWHALLVYELLKNPLWLKGIAKLIDRVMGKSVVFYFKKSA